MTGAVTIVVGLVLCIGVTAATRLGVWASAGEPGGPTRASQAHGATPGDPGWMVTFTDVAQQAGIRQPVVYGDVSEKRFIVETNGAGVALVDVDDDGWLDGFVLNGTRLEPGTRRDRRWSEGEAPVSRLYLNQRDGTFRDVTSTSGLARTGWASGVCAGDYDRDGRIDLHVTYFGENVLYRNAGQARFTDVTRRARLPVGARRWGSGCSFLDFDRDGHLDLFVANYLALDLDRTPEPGQGINCLWKGVAVNCGPKGLPFDTNLLYRNNGDGTFTDVSGPSGIAKVTGRYSMTAVATDLDADGWTDIYVAGDSTAAILYRNNRDGTFTDVAVESGAAYSDQGMPQAGMGVALADCDGNGLLDLVKTHFADDIPSLYRALGKGLFEDVAMAMGLGVQNRHVEWGVGLPDFDNDGWPDLMYVTGSVYPEVERAFPQYPHRGPRVVFRNLQGRRFDDVTSRSGPATVAAQSSRGAAFGDYDNDGDVDVLVFNMSAPPSLLRNDQRTGHHWLQIRLAGATGNAFALGAIVRLTAAGRTHARAVLSQSSYYSLDDLRAHFGLGNATTVERLEVQWPSGRVERFDVPGVDRVITVREATGVDAAGARPAPPPHHVRR